MNKIFFWKPIPKVEGIVDESCLGQWYPSLFKVNNIEYACAEQFMMASKAELFKDLETREKIMHCTNPFEMKKLGREIKNFDSEVWDKHKEKIVFAGNMNKFLQNSDLKDYLLSTEDAELYEASPYDKIWGIGLSKEEAINRKKPYPGLNLLGKALMKVRAEIKRGIE